MPRGPAAQQPPAAPPQPPTFRVGVGAVRVDVTVIGRNSLPVTDLTRDDFEVREDGVVQRVQLFQHVTLTGQPPAGSDESLAIRSPDHARQEAGRDDVRLLVIFLDDYHLKFGAIADTRLRSDLVRFIQAEMRPLDLFAVMGPLTPISDLGLTRDKSRLLDRVNQVQGRLGGFVPPRSAIEEAHTRLGAGDLDPHPRAGEPVGARVAGRAPGRPARGPQVHPLREPGPAHARRRPRDVQRACAK